MDPVQPFGPPPARPLPARPHASQDDAALRQADIDLEAGFLAEMLKSAGLGETGGAFDGGAGEAQFSSLLVRAQAEQIARAGGIGLAEKFFHALKERQDATT